jgi:hypothetical protein
MRELFIILTALSFLGLNCPAQVYSAAQGYSAVLTRPWASVSVSTNQTIVFTDLTGGVHALVQFTSFSVREASYRWRFFGSGTNITSGTGKVVESYEHIEKDGTLHWNAKAKPDHDPFVKAGPIAIEWAYGTQTNGWLIYHQGFDKVELLDRKAFENGPVPTQTPSARK